MPRFVDHARDVALLSQEPGELGVLILDFKNAFMTLPLARAEMGYNASIIPEQITRQRKALFPQECTMGPRASVESPGIRRSFEPLILLARSIICCQIRSGIVV